MGIFSKKQNRVEEEPIVYIQKTEVMRGNDECRYGHAIDGVVPTVNMELFEIQNPQFIGMECDCKQLTYAGEEKCGCSIPRWEIKWKEATFDYSTLNR